MLPGKDSGFRGVIRHLSSTALLLLLSVLLMTCGGPRHDTLASLRGYNLIIIVADALRADHLGCYGYPRRTSRFLDSLAEEGIVFEHVISNSSYTRESVSALFSGQLPSRSGSVGWGARPRSEIPGLASLFSRAGYQTALFTDWLAICDSGFTHGFHESECFLEGSGPQPRSQGGRGNLVSERAAQFVEDSHNSRFMMYLHYQDPHSPYSPPRNTYLRFRESVFDRPLRLFHQFRPQYRQLMEEGFGPGEERFEDLVTRYDAEIAVTDRAIEILFERLEALDVLRKTLVVITSDHGEEFLEHGYLEHAWTLYNESLHVPLILWSRDSLRPGRYDTRLSLIDILPTVLSLLEIPHDHTGFDGRAFYAEKNDGFHFHDVGTPLITELLIQHRCMMRAVIHRNLKYIAVQKWIAPEERFIPFSDQQRQIEESQETPVDLWGDLVREELYDLLSDPGEKQNLLASPGSTAHGLRDVLRAYRARCTQTIPSPQHLSPEDLDRLKALGYL